MTVSARAGTVSGLPLALTTCLPNAGHAAFGERPDRLISISLMLPCLVLTFLTPTGRGPR
jgi:hypothetical protein